MAGKREALRNELTRRLLEAATERMEKYGLDGVSAREVTADAQCGLGTIYKCYRDLDELILRVNSRTLKRLDSVLAAAVQPTDAPEVRLVRLALAYLDFALSNNNAWSALFKHRMAAASLVPDWHIAEHRALFQHICRPLAQIDPELSEQDLTIRARSIFAAVHGIVALSIEGKFVGLKRDVVSAELETVVSALIRGLAPCSV
ncbi:MAG: TetR/AcrR family transcriptional regulator [Hyphomicrobiaceae bacterium]